MSFPKKILFWLLTVLTIPAVCLLVLEIGLRLSGAQQWATPGYIRTHPERRYELRPDFVGTAYDTELRINSYGLRDYEREISLDAGTFRICVFGDSYTFGHGGRMEDSFVKVLEKKLQDSADRPVQVFNFGIPSYNTVSEMLYLKDSYERFRPHLVIVEYTASNDTELKDPPGSAEGANQIAAVRRIKDLLRRLYSYNFLANKYYTLRYQIAYGQQIENAMEARVTHDERLYEEDFQGWIEAKQAFREIVSFCDSKNVELVFAIVANTMQLAETFEDDPMHSIVTRVVSAMEDAGARHIVMLDEAFRDYAGREALLHIRPDDAHFSPLANELVADALYRFVTERHLAE
jgi:hypothetical protein